MVKMMARNVWIFLVVFIALLSLSLSLEYSTQAQGLPSPTPTTIKRAASPAELAEAQAAWSQSKHAETYDEGMGANTTCARCKSPFNYDPTQDLAAQEALDCNSCKRIPGQARPELDQGVQVAQVDWRNVSCEVCHIPVGDTYDVGISFWNQAEGAYEAVETPSELCAHCHEGQHGFKVVEEQLASKVHKNLGCTDCHGKHGEPSACTDCHDPTAGPGALEHARHETTNCTACHDAGGLSVWVEEDPDSKHYQQYITRRFAHALTSWPSHDLSRQVDCKRCHHPGSSASTERASVAADIPCDACHEHDEGAVLLWCTYFERNPDPKQSLATPEAQP